MSGKHTQKTDEALLAAKLATGIEKHLPATTPILISGDTLTPVQVADQLRHLATLRAEVEAAKAVLKGRLADETKEAPALRAFASAVIAFVRVAYGGAPEILADFGLAPKKERKPQSGEQQAAAAAKRASTRAARGTMGKRQRAAIKGNVTGVVVTTITAPPVRPPSAPSAPSANGTAASGAAAPLE